MLPRRAACAPRRAYGDIARACRCYRRRACLLLPCYMLPRRAGAPFAAPRALRGVCAAAARWRHAPSLLARCARACALRALARSALARAPRARSLLPRTRACRALFALLLRAFATARAARATRRLSPLFSPRMARSAPPRRTARCAPQRATRAPACRSAMRCNRVRWFIFAAVAARSIACALPLSFCNMRYVACGALLAFVAYRLHTR